MRCFWRTYFERVLRGRLWHRRDRVLSARRRRAAGYALRAGQWAKAAGEAARAAEGGSRTRDGRTHGATHHSVGSRVADNEGAPTDAIADFFFDDFKLLLHFRHDRSRRCAGRVERVRGRSGAGGLTSRWRARPPSTLARHARRADRAVMPRGGRGRAGAPHAGGGAPQPPQLHMHARTGVTCTLHGWEGRRGYGAGA